MDFASVGLTPELVIATTAYAIVGFVLMVVCFIVFDKIFKIDIKKELTQDDNAAVGILLGAVAIATSIIIAASIVS